MSTRFAALCAVPLIGMLAACSDDASETADGNERDASGEVLEGSISDAMLPLDQLRSQAPLEAAEESDGSSGNGDATADGSAAGASAQPADDADADDGADDAVGQTDSEED